LDYYSLKTFFLIGSTASKLALRFFVLKATYSELQNKDMASKYKRRRTNMFEVILEIIAFGFLGTFSIYEQLKNEYSKIT
jgi:hypothetical protein